MNSSEFVPIKKKEYINKLVELEAENKALQKKLKTYENFLRRKLKEKTPTNVPDLHDYPDEVKRDAETLMFKKNAYTYIKEPQRNENIIPAIVTYLQTPKKFHQIKRDEIQAFLQDF